MGSIPTPAGTHTHECGYGFHVGMGVGWHDVTHGLPTMNTTQDHEHPNAQAENET